MKGRPRNVACCAGSTMIKDNYLKVLKSLCDLPTAPYCEQHVIAWLLAWAEGHAGKVTAEQDQVGNVYLHYTGGGVGRSAAPLVIEAHMDHPGFVAGAALVGEGGGRMQAEFWGGVKPSFFDGAAVRFWVNEPLAVGDVRAVGARGRWVRGRVGQVTPSVTGFKNTLDVLVEDLAEPVPAGCMGMWDLPDSHVEGEFFGARVCDDVAGVAAVVCLLEELIAQDVPGHAIGLLTRAEEVGFAGALAVCMNGWLAPGARVIGLETSQAAPREAAGVAGGGGAQGDGAIVRVGDKTGLFSAGLTHFVSQAAAGIADDDKDFKWQRRLMGGGTCNTTVFVAWGYDAAAMCVGLGNYHNMTAPGAAGWGDGARTGEHIASETIHLGDFSGMVRILIEVARGMGAGKYQPGFGVIRERFRKLHEAEQRARLWATAGPVVEKD